MSLWISVRLITLDLVMNKYMKAIKNEPLMTSLQCWIVNGPGLRGFQFM